MPTFRYRAYDDAGRAVSGELEAEGLKDAVERLRRKGLHPSKVSAAAAAAAGGRAVGADMLALTTRQLATLLGSGSRVTDALSVLADEGGFARLRPVLLDIKDSVAQGNSLARSLETRPDIFSPLYRGLVAAGEASGSLDRALARLADYLETRARITREVKAALAYPALMTVVGTGVLTFLFIFVVPKITRIFEEREAALPWMTVVLMAVTDLVSRYWPYLLIAAAAVAAALRGLFRSGAYRGRLDALLLRVPWFGRLLVHFHTANMARTLGSLLLGGVPLLKALEMTRGAVDNRVFEETLEAAQRRCAEGASLSASLSAGHGGRSVIPPVVVHMIGIGEKSGELGPMLVAAADTYEKELEAGIKATLGMLEPLLIVVMGVVVGFIVLAILLPLFELNQVVT